MITASSQVKLFLLLIVWYIVIIEIMALDSGSLNVKQFITHKITAKKESSALIALIVDDDSVLHKIHKGILGRFGFKTLTAENGKQAVELCQSGVHFDLITMDFEMPIMDGVEATKRLRDMGVDCKIVAATACAEDTLEKRFIEAGINHFCTKPLTVEEVASFLKNMGLRT